MKKFTIHAVYEEGDDATVYEIEGDDVTIADGHLRVHKDGAIVYDDLVSVVTSLDSIEVTDTSQSDGDGA